MLSLAMKRSSSVSVHLDPKSRFGSIRSLQVPSAKPCVRHRMPSGTSPANLRYSKPTTVIVFVFLSHLAILFDSVPSVPWPIGGLLCMDVMLAMHQICYWKRPNHEESIRRQWKRTRVGRLERRSGRSIVSDWCIHIPAWSTRDGTRLLRSMSDKKIRCLSLPKALR